MESGIKVISRNSESLSGTEFRQGFAVFMKCIPTGKKTFPLSRNLFYEAKVLFRSSGGAI